MADRKHLSYRDLEDKGTGDASLADELAGHFQWPLDQENGLLAYLCFLMLMLDNLLTANILPICQEALHFRLPEEVNELRIELRQMQTLQEGQRDQKCLTFKRKG